MTRVVVSQAQCDDPVWFRGSRIKVGESFPTGVENSPDVVELIRIGKPKWGKKFRNFNLDSFFVFRG